MPFMDLQSSADRMAELVRGVDASRLDVPTPCADYTLAALLDHVDRVTLGFTAAATRANSTQSPVGDAARLGSDWRTRIPAHLAGLVEAWESTPLVDGMTQAGGVDLPVEIAPIVALEELVIHGWDVARASGQPFACADSTLAVVEGFVAQFAGDGQADLRGTAYAGPIPVGDAASHLDHVVALSGRVPGWSASV